MENAGARPPRLRIINVRTGQGIVAQFNPSELTEGVNVQWELKTPLGHSHGEHQYLGTTNVDLTFELYFDRLATPEIREPDLAAVGVNEITNYDDARAFLYSLAYASENASSVMNGGPPRVLVIWPGVVSLTCHLASVRFNHARFAVTGHSTIMTAEVVFQEVRDVRLTSEAVLANGTRRAV